MKRILIFGIFLVALAAIVGGWLVRREEADEAPFRLFGTVEIRDVRLSFAESEIVASMEVEEGTWVEAGQLLGTLRSQRIGEELARAEAQVKAQKAVLERLVNGTRPLEIEQRRAEVKAAEARVENARRALKRYAETTSTGASSVQQRDDAEAALETAEAERAVRLAALELALDGPREETIAEARALLESAQAQEALLRRRMEDTRLFAPAAGFIQSRILEPGEAATPSKPAYVLAKTDPKWIRAYLPEPMLGRLKEGQSALIFSDSWDEPLAGRVGFISPVAEFTPKAVQTEDLRTQLVYEVRIWVEDPENRFRLGMPVTVVPEAKGA